MCHGAYGEHGETFDTTILNPERGGRCVTGITVPLPTGLILEAFFVSTVSVALAEIGDKTQLLALVLAARFRKPWPVLAGMLLATLINHGIAAQVGAWLTWMLSPQTLRWTVALSFIAVGLWILVPDRDGDKSAGYAHGAFLTTLVAFFLAEIGDKTQLATVVLAASYDEIAAVVLGTTVGMMLANVPVVFAGSLAAPRIPLKVIRAIAAITFVALGMVVFFTDNGIAG